MSVSARVAVRAPELLARFNQANLLTAADLQVARRLGSLCGEDDEAVLLAAALAVRELRAGSVCLLLTDRAAMLTPTSEDAAVSEEGTGTPLTDDDLPSPERWRDLLAASPLVNVVTDVPAASTPVPDQTRPLRLHGSRLYLDRYWRDEDLVRRFVTAALQAPISDVDPLRVGLAVQQVFTTDPELAQQRSAAAAAAFSRFTVLTGGPGTGKTTTVARILAVLHRVAGPGLDVALAAPTGKAAARLTEAVAEQLAELGPDDQNRVGALRATTLHRLLGKRPGSQVRFRHDRNNQLPHDVIVIDESSMLALPLMARLVEALRPQTRLILVGDADQLASVEAGAVLGDLVARPSTADELARAIGAATPEDVVKPAAEHGSAATVVRLRRRWRFSGVIGQLADAVRAGDEDGALALLTSNDESLEFVVTDTARWDPEVVGGLRREVESAGLAMLSAARAGDADTALAALGEHRLLLAHRHGPFGVVQWASQVERWIREADPAPAVSGRGVWTPGRPLLVGVNDQLSGLYNGDTGVLINAGGGEGSVVAVFGGRAVPLRVPLHRLPAVETVYAMTVHKAQGSQFTGVTVLLPPPSSPLLTRELFYTGITRARQRVRVVGSEEAVRAAVRRRVRRASGLRDV